MSAEYEKAQQSPQEIVGFIRQRDVAALKTLRRFYEAQPEGMTAEQALVLCDVCHQLGMSEGETAAVVGPFFVMMDG